MEIQQAKGAAALNGHEIMMQQKTERELGRDIEGRTLRTVLREAIQRILDYRRDSITKPTISEADRNAAFAKVTTTRPTDDTAGREQTTDRSQGLSL